MTTTVNGKALTTPDGSETPLTLHDQPNWRPRTHCPACGTVLELALRCTAFEVVTPRPNADPDHDTTPEHEVITAARRADLLEPFFRTVRVVKRDQPPKDLDAFFVTFVRGLTQRIIPAYAMKAFNALFDSRPLNYYTSQGIGVVVVDGYMRLFVPNRDVVGTRLKTAGTTKQTTHTLKIDDGEVKLQEWIHTRWGYVAGTGALYEQLHNRSIGEFARPNLSGPE
jgi:hypothetical protein